MILVVVGRKSTFPYFPPSALKAAADGRGVFFSPSLQSTSSSVVHGRLRLLLHLGATENKIKRPAEEFYLWPRFLLQGEGFERQQIHSNDPIRRLLLLLLLVDVD